MTQTFVWLCAIVKCVYFWSGNPDIGHVYKHRNWKQNIKLKHNDIKNSKQLNWFDRIQ